MFNEDASMLEPFEFFAVFHQFIVNYKKCVVENAKRREAPKKQGLGINVMTTDQFNDKFKDVTVSELPVHPILGTNKKMMG